MTTPESPQPRSGGAHRAAPAAEPASSTPLLLPLLSVVAVLGAMGLAAWMLMTAGDDETPTTNPTGAVSQPTTQPSDQPSDKPSDEPSDKPSDEPTKDDDKNDGDKNDGDKSTEPVPQIAVYVFNQTTIRGLAAQTADELEALGWDVVGVDNWVGTVPDDTVYFYPGDREKAELLAKASGISRVWPASAPMPAAALTVILADEDRK